MIKMNSKQVAAVLARCLTPELLEEIEINLVMEIAEIEESSQDEPCSDEDYWFHKRADSLAEALQDLLEVNQEVPSPAPKRDRASLAMVPPGYVL